MSKPKVIAFYLPQYHPTPDNDRWWGKGFTEWTNVAKARPLFRGHYQPHVPADLGFYDLRLPEVREAQAQLAREAGIYGFCYYHYWFGNGKEELELPFNEVLRLGKPDFPFMLCWANESWHRKFWDKDGKGTSKEVLVEQTYPGDEDHIAHFYRLLPAFKDPRYIRIDGKPAFMIYKPRAVTSDFLKLWQRLAIENGLAGIFFVAHVQSLSEQGFTETECLEQFKAMGYSAMNPVRILRQIESRSLFNKISNRLLRNILRRPFTYSYTKAMRMFSSVLDINPDVFPTLVPNWDHTPRSGLSGLVYKDATPERFREHAVKMLADVSSKDEKHQIVFLKSWNEWGEGNYMEPDLKYGKNFIYALASAFNKIK